MKARVIETDKIEEFQANEFNDYFTKDGVHYKGLELDFEDVEPDYWTKLHHQAAIAAMQTLLPQYEKMRHIETMEGFKNGLIKEGSDVDKIRKEHEILLADASIGYATALVDKLKNEK